MKAGGGMGTRPPPPAMPGEPRPPSGSPRGQGTCPACTPESAPSEPHGKAGFSLAGGYLGCTCWAFCFDIEICDFTLQFWTKAKPWISKHSVSLPQSELACARARAHTHVHIHSRKYVHTRTCMAHFLMCAHTHTHSHPGSPSSAQWPLLWGLAFQSPAPVPGLLPISVPRAVLCSPLIYPTSVITCFKMTQTELGPPDLPQSVARGLSHFGKWHSIHSTVAQAQRPSLLGPIRHTHKAGGSPLPVPGARDTCSHPHAEGRLLPASLQPLHTSSPLRSQDDLQTSWAPRTDPSLLMPPPGPRTRPESEPSPFSQLPVIAIHCPAPATSPLP